MKKRDHDVYREWVYLGPEGPRGLAERSELSRHLEGCGECRALARELAAMDGLLEASRVEVDPGMKDRVLRNLPPAAWESRRPASWGVAAALLALLGGGSIGVAALSGGLRGASPLAGAVLGLFDMLQSAALTGAGLLTASWQGVGLAIQESLGGSPASLVAFGVVVLGLDVLFLRFLTRASRAHVAARDTGDLDARR